MNRPAEVSDPSPTLGSGAWQVRGRCKSIQIKSMQIDSNQVDSNRFKSAPPRLAVVRGKAPQTAPTSLRKVLAALKELAVSDFHKKDMMTVSSRNTYNL